MNITPPRIDFHIVYNYLIVFHMLFLTQLLWSRKSCWPLFEDVEMKHRTVMTLGQGHTRKFNRRET